MGGGEETECLGTPQGVGVNFLKKKIFSFECAKKVGGGGRKGHARTQNYPSLGKGEGKESQASNKMRGRENERGVENVRKKARSARANK